MARRRIAVWRHGGERTLIAVAIVRLFAAARTTAGRGRDELPGDTVEAVLGTARDRYGSAFAEILTSCRIWVNGESASGDTAVGPTDEVAVLPPVSGGAVSSGDGSLDELRARRDHLQALDDAVSYVRRVAQGRADLARDALTRAGGPDVDTAGRDLGAGLRAVLADRLLGGGDRPPRPAEDFSDHPLSGELDALCAEFGFGQLDELTPTGLTKLVEALDGFEQRVSAQRRDVFVELDAVTDEIVERYRAQQPERDGEPDTEGAE